VIRIKAKSKRISIFELDLFSPELQQMSILQFMVHKNIDG